MESRLLVQFDLPTYNSPELQPTLSPRTHAAMLRYRKFRNTDPPALVAIWRSRSGQPGLLQPISVDLLEQFVLGKLYFDCEGLFLAWDEDRPIGFAHAAFGPHETNDRISTDLGVVNLVLVHPDCAQEEVAAGLLEHCERYLADRGVRVVYGGGIRPLNPFYLGLYGGSELPGVLETDRVAVDLFRSHGYREIDHVLLFQADLHKFRSPVSRQQMRIRREMMVQVTVDPPSRTWWEACTTGDFDLTRFDLVPRGGQPVGQATVRTMDVTGAPGYCRTVGLIELEVDPNYRRRGLITFLLTEAFHQLARQGVARVDVQTMEHNTAAVRLYRKLGFRQLDRGIVFRKDSSGGGH